MKVSGVSYSSDKKLVRCEQQYSYRYDQKLKPREKPKGLYMGAFMHDLLEAYRRKQSWRKRFKELKKEMWDPLFDEEKERLEEKGFSLALTQDLMEHYVDHWSDVDKDLVAVEIEKSYEKMTKFGWPMRWKADYVVRDGDCTILRENKNKKKLPESDERILAPQVHAYCYLLSLVGVKIDVIEWDYIRTTPVPAPKILKSGELSTAKCNTDQRSYTRVLTKAGKWPKDEQELIDLEDHLKTLPETLSLMRVRNKPNLIIGKLFVRDWIDRARRAEKIKRPTRNWDRSCSWMCDYFTLCQIDMLGKDRDAEIKKNFVQISRS